MPKVIRTDNVPEFAGRTMRDWAATNCVEMRFIEPGKPVQNACIESFNSRFRDECLSQHWFASLSHMRSVLDNWRDDYNHRRGHSSPGYGLRLSSQSDPPPTIHSRHLRRDWFDSV